MKIETIVDELLDSHYKLIHHWNEQGHYKRYRQYHALRDRIIRMDAEKDEEIDRCEMDIELLEAELVTTDAG